MKKANLLLTFVMLLLLISSCFSKWDKPPDDIVPNFVTSYLLEVYDVESRVEDNSIILKVQGDMTTYYGYKKYLHEQISKENRDVDFNQKRAVSSPYPIFRDTITGIKVTSDIAFSEKQPPMSGLEDMLTVITYSAENVIASSYSNMNMKSEESLSDFNRRDHYLISNNIILKFKEVPPHSKNFNIIIEVYKKKGILFKDTVIF